MGSIAASLTASLKVPLMYCRPVGIEHSHRQCTLFALKEVMDTIVNE